MKKSILLSVMAIFLFTKCGQNHKHDDDHKHEHKHENEHHEKKLHNAAEYDNVKTAILDYVEGLYEVDSIRIERSVYPELRKVGYWFNKRDSVYVNNSVMTYNQLVSLSARWNKDGSRVTKDSPKDIVIYEIYDKTASARLVAEWGIDFFQLGKFDGKWQIVNVMWQSPPKN